MRGQFFYMICISLFVVMCHALFIWRARVKKWFGGKLPEMFKFPHIEITLFIIFSMGMLDVAFNVLATPNTANGWKVINVDDAWTPSLRGSYTLISSHFCITCMHQPFMQFFSPPLPPSQKYTKQKKGNCWS
jgi:hypothetical protein